SNQDLTLVRWLADCLTIGLSHRRLAETARRTAVEQERVATAESLMELLKAISGVLDVRTVFPQISAIASKLVAHDFLTMSFHDRDGTIVIEAASGHDPHRLRRIVTSNDSQPPDRFLIVDDF